jgi:hypothetical protein
MVLTTHSLLALRLSMGTAKPLPPLSACLEFYGTAFMFLVDLSVIKEIVPWKLSFYEQVIFHFTRCVIDNIDAGVNRLNYMTHVDTSNFLHIKCIFPIIDGLIFCNFICHMKYLGSYIFFPRGGGFIHTFSSISFWASTNSAVALWNELSLW